MLNKPSISIIPAKAGIHASIILFGLISAIREDLWIEFPTKKKLRLWMHPWIPAFAGMTEERGAIESIVSPPNALQPICTLAVMGKVQAFDFVFLGGAEGYNCFGDEHYGDGSDN